MRVLGVVPARGGSKGVPRKNISPLGGRPLLLYTVDAAQKSRLLTRLVVSTEDPEIAAISRGAGVEVIHRPPELAADDTPTWPVVLHAVRTVEESDERYDAVFTLQATTPFRSAADIDDAITMLADTDTDTDSVIGVVRVYDNHPARIKRIEDGLLSDFCVPEPEGTRRQDLPPAFLRNGAVYLTRRDVIESGSIRGVRQRPFVMPAERSVNIDEPIDFLLAEALLARSSGRA